MMRILVDLIHPANYHYFKHFIDEMHKLGNTIIITARKKDVLQDLLKIEKHPFIDVGKGKIGKGALGKLLYLIYAEILFLIIFIRKKPDIVISFASTPCAHNCFLLKIPHISFDDTEHAKLNRRLYAPFTDVIFTPMCFYGKFHKNRLKFNGYMELFYLHPYRFKSNNSYEKLKKDSKRKTILLRFVSWEAFHDIGQHGIYRNEKIDLVKILSKDYNLFISSESPLPPELIEFRLNIPVNEIHGFISNIDLYIGEGGTMASECAILGVPSIYINSLPLMGYLKEALDHGLLFHLKSLNEIVSKVNEILLDENSKEKFFQLKKKFISDKIDPTSMLVWFICNYPKSKFDWTSNPDIQQNFIRNC